MGTNTSDMNPAEFREWGHRAVEWIADYMEHPERYPVLSAVPPGWVRARLAEQPPRLAEPMEDIFRDLNETIVPGMTHWNHPAFFAYFAITGSGPGILGELFSAAFNINGMLWRTSPSATELEETVLDWLRQMIGLPPAFKGIVYDTASVSTFHAIVAARQAVSEYDFSENGSAGATAPRLRMYTSAEAHSSVEKGAIAAGIGRRNFIKIPVDSHFRMDARLLEAAIQRDVREGLRPFCVSATVGTTSTTSVDPVAAIADICERYGLWLHVDAAYAGPAAILPEMRHILEGCDRADSLVTNPHKWLFTPVDFSAFYCRRPEVLRQAFSLTPDYLKTADSAVTNFMDYGIQLGRRFRSLKFWMVVRYFGVEGLQARIREHIRLGRLFAQWVEESPDFELKAPAPFSTVCFRAKGDDGLNQRIINAVNASGKAFISQTRLRDETVLRFTVGNLRTTEDHVRLAWELILEAHGRAR